MKMTNVELIRLWANDEKRRAFLANYKEWGMWLENTELGLTCYKCDLPKGHRILAVEYQRKDAYSPKSDAPLRTLVDYYLWEGGERFVPTPTALSYIAEWLKHLKMELIREQKGQPDE